LSGPFCPTFDFLIADPPFNIGQSYQDYDDNMPTHEYRQFCIEWIIASWNKLKPGAVMVLHGSIKVSREILRALFQTQLDDFIETEICWAYNFGQCNFNNWIETHCRAIVLRKPGKDKKWYVEKVMTPSKRLLMGDKRVSTSRYKGMVPFGSVWGIKTEDQVALEPMEGEQNWGRVQGNNKERRHGHPNQLPEVYIERFYNAYTQPGDIIYVVFGGSGTEIAVAKRMGRSAIATEVSPWACESIKGRLNDVNV
jgi:site-specific DNA-methyltransferase (adenine-specific)